MPELSSSTYSATDASNTSASPDGAPEGMAPSGVNNTIRALIGSTKRFWQRIQTGGGTFGGSTNAYTITYTPALSAYISGERYSFVANADNTGSATVNINSLGAKTLRKVTSAGKVALASGDIKNTQPVTVEYDGTDMVMVTPVANLSAGTVTSIVAGTGLSGGTITSSGTVALDINSLTTKTTPEPGTDFASIYSGDDVAPRKTLVEKLGRVVQRVYDEERTFSNNTSYTFIPADDTKPEITEGVEILSATITPTSASNRIRVRAVVPVGPNAGISGLLSIHRGGQALASTWGYGNGAQFVFTSVAELEEASPGTSAVTYSVRFGAVGAATGFEICARGSSGARQFGGAACCSLVVEEIVP